MSVQDDIPWEEPPVREEIPWEEPPLPDTPPWAEPEPVRAEVQPKPAVPKVVETPQPAAAPTGALSGNWWRDLVESCKGRLSPMYRVFLDMCSGTLEDGLLTVYAPDEMTLGRLDNDRVKGALAEEGARAAGGPVRLMLRVGEAPKASPQENFKDLLRFGSGYDNIQIK